MTRRLLAVCAIFVVAVPCFGGRDKEFHALVKTIEAQYGVRHVHIPFFGLATFCLRVARVPGTAGLKIAVFENLPNSDVAANDAFQEAVQAAIGSRWHPVVRARSRDDGDLTMIYADPDAKQMWLLIVAAEGGEATVVQAKLKTAQIRKWLKEPQETADRDTHDPLQAVASTSDE
jgi:hypothetical protein